MAMTLVRLRHVLRSTRDQRLCSIPKRQAGPLLMQNTVLFLACASVESVQWVYYVDDEPTSLHAQRRVLVGLLTSRWGGMLGADTAQWADDPVLSINVEIRNAQDFLAAHRPNQFRLICKSMKSFSLPVAKCFYTLYNFIRVVPS